MPISSASAMPSANERSEIDTAALNFAVGMIVIAAAITPENGGTMVDSLARPTISQTTNHTNSENRIGILLPNRIISSHEFQMNGKRGQIASQTRPEGGAGRKRTLLSTLRTGDDRERSTAPQVVPRLHIVLQDLPYLVNGIEIVLVPADLVGVSPVAVDVGLDDLRYRSRPRR